MFSFDLNGFENINITEIFNDVVLNKNVPFASCGKFFKILREKIPFNEWASDTEDVIILRLCQEKMSNSQPSDYTPAILNIENNIVSTKIQLNINRNSIDEKKAVNEIVNVFATSKLNASNQKQISISGVFYVSNQKMNNYVFSDLVMNNRLFSNILTINENIKTSKKKAGLYIHFNLLSVGYVTANLTERIVTRNDYYQTNMNRDMFPMGSYYVRVKITRTDSVDTALKFVDMICKLFVIYNEEQGKIVKLYREYIPSFAKEEVKQPQPLLIKEKEQNLRDIAPEIFHSNYSRKCIYKPTVIPDEDVGIHKDKHIIKFPKDDKITQPRYYICDHDKHKYVGLRANPFDNKNKFPFLPCCYIKNQELIKGSEFRQYYHDEKPPIREIKQQHLFVTDKFVSEGMFGRLPRDIDSLFNTFSADIKYIYLRKGVERSQSSFIHCIMDVLGLSRGNIDNVLSEREKMANENFASSCRQEMYDRTVDEIMDEIINADAYMSPRKYIHGIETYFDCDIFLFTRDSINGELTVPDHLQAYYKNETKRKCVLIFEHMGSESDNSKYPQCEIICRWNSDNESDIRYVFEHDDEIITGIEKAYNEMSLYYLLDKPLENIVMRFGGNIIAQTIDSYGKTRMLYVKYKENVLTLLTSPIPPLSVKEIYVNTPMLAEVDNSIEFITNMGMRLIGKNFQNEINSLVCVLGNVRVAIPVNESESLNKFETVDSNLICANFDNSFLNQHNIAKKYARYFVEYLFWIFSRFLRNNSITERKIAFDLIEKFVSENIVIDSEFEFENVTKFFTLNGGILRDEKMIVTSEEILRRLVFVLRTNIQRNFSELVNYHNRKMIESYYMNTGDFTRHWQQIVLEGVGSVLEWIENRDLKYIMYDEIVDKKQPYFFRNKLVSDKVFLAKNTNTLDDAIHTIVIWKDRGYIPLEENKDVINLEFVMFLYKNRENIECYLVSGEKNAYNIKVLGYRNDNDENRFVALVDV
jgi:hypothetical protein